MNYEDMTFEEKAMKIPELLELAKKAQFSSKDGLQFTPDQTKYISEMSPAIMVPLLERYLELEKLVETHKDLMIYRGECK